MDKGEKMLSECKQCKKIMHITQLNPVIIGNKTTLLCANCIKKINKENEPSLINNAKKGMFNIINSIGKK